MGALKQQKEVLSALFYNDNDLECRKKEKRNNEAQAKSQITSFTATLSILPGEDIDQKLVVFRFWSHYFCKWGS